MENIDTVLGAFLAEQHNRLKQKSYRDYEDVIHFFQDYLNQYAPNRLNEDEWKKWEAQFHEDEDCYTKMFSPEKLSSGSFDEFLDYFMIRKVMSSVSFMKAAVKVMKKLNKWLFENGYINQSTYHNVLEYFDEAKDLPDVEKLADLFLDYAEKTPDKPFEEILEGYFSIKSIERGQLWLDEAIGSKRDIGPLRVSTQISNLCKKGWDINVAIGKYQGEWYILESGNVYR
ncbi:hypothetical protein GCM10007063_16820 [Lentibacillus kapialis]|uniref:Uncharacterized protein n=1 Tax=Lentibacillus kapialis TaxID=340214 RepID=A0A917PWF1_9BACI|nr:hypothetical protein [Lentibacillus kapialis]GGJ94913.1 hypothetical protein GCM10007063_16820 [Lentibacillus kapialis]